MAYGLKYYFDDKLQVGSTNTTYRFEILQDGYSGSATEWIGREISRQYEEVSLRKIEPIQKSSCTGIIAVESSSQRTILESIAGSEPGQYKVQLKKDGSVIWTGLVIPDLTVIGEDNYGNQSANIVAKDIFITGNFPLATIFPDTRGIEKAIILIADILGDMDYQLDIISYTSWTEAGLTQSDDILNQSYHEKERFRKFGRTEGEDDQPLTNQEALEYILTAYGLILRQVDGDWNLLQITAFENPSSVRRYVYDYQGTQTSSSTTFTAPSITEGNDLYVQGSSSNNYFAGVKSVKSQFQHESLIQGIKFNREYWIDDGSELAKSQYWQADGTGNLELSFITWYAKTTIADLGNPVIITVSIFVDTGSTDYYWNGTSWVTSPAGISVEVQETHSAVDSVGNYIFKNLGIDIVTDPIPSGADGTLNVKITPDSLQPNFAYWYLRDVQFSLKYSDTTDGISTDILYELTQTQAFSSVYDYGKYYFGDGPTEASLSALKNSSRVLLSQWKRAGDSSTTNHQNLILNEILNVRRGQRRNIRARLYGEYEPDNILVYDSTNFFFLGGSWSSRSYQWSANFFEINISEVDTDSLSFTFVTDGSGTSGGAVGSTGSSTGTSSLYLEKGKNLSDLPTPATARTNLGLGTGDSPTFNGLTSTGVIITDEIDTTSIVWDALTPEVFWVTSEEKFNNPVFIGTSLDVDNGINADQHIHAGTYLKADTYLEVGTSATIGTTLDVGTNTTVGGTLDVTGATTLSTLDASANTTVGGTLSVTGNTTLSSNLNFSPTVGNAIIDSGANNLEISALKTFINQNTEIDGALTLLGALNVDGATTLNSNLELNGSADFNSTMNLQGNLTTQANLSDDGFSEGWAGTNWKINADGSAEFEEMRIRGALRVYEFIAKQISTIGGSEILSIAQGRVVSAGSGEIEIENVTGTPGNSFKAGDLFICQVVDINNDLESGGTGSIVKSVRGLVDSVSGNDLTVTIESGSLDDLEQGDLIVGYGSTSDADRQAIMYRNVDRSEDSLIMRLQTGITEFSKLQDEANTRVAFGDLGPKPGESIGYSGLDSETFGFFAGSNSGGHILATSSGLFLKDGSTTLAQLTNNTFKVGSGTKYIEFDGNDLDVQAEDFKLEAGGLVIDSSLNKKIVVKNASEAIIAIGDFDFGAEVEDLTTESQTSSAISSPNSDATATITSNSIDTGYGDTTSTVAEDGLLSEGKKIYDIAGKWTRIQFNWSATEANSTVGDVSVSYSIRYPIGNQIAETRSASDTLDSGSVDTGYIFIPADAPTANQEIKVQALGPIGGLPSGEFHGKVSVSNIVVTTVDNEYTYTDIGNDGFRVYNSGGRNKLDFSDGKAEGTFETLSIGEWDFVLDGDGNLELQYDGTLVQQFTKP